MLIPINLASAVGLSSGVAILDLSQIVEIDASAIFHNLGKAFSDAEAHTDAMSSNKNGGPNHLRAWRLWRRMTLEELAEKVETTASVIGYLESGERGLSAKWLRRLAPALGTKPGILLDHAPEDISTAVMEMWIESEPVTRRDIENVVSVLARRDGTTSR